MRTFKDLKDNQKKKGGMEKTGVLSIKDKRCHLIHDDTLKSYIEIANEGYSIIQTQMWEQSSFTPVSKFSVKTSVSFFMKKNTWCKDELVICKNKKCFLYCLSCRHGRKKLKFNMFNEKGRQKYMLHKCKDAVRYIYPWFTSFQNKDARREICLSLLYPNVNTISKQIDEKVMIHTLLGPNMYPLMESIRDYAQVYSIVNDTPKQENKLDGEKKKNVKMKTEICKAIFIINSLLVD